MVRKYTKGEKKEKLKNVTSNEADVLVTTRGAWGLLLFSVEGSAPLLGQELNLWNHNLCGGFCHWVIAEW